MACNLGGTCLVEVIALQCLQELKQTKKKKEKKSGKARSPRLEEGIGS